MMSAFILAGQAAARKRLAWREAAVLLGGTFAGSVVVTFVKPPKNKIKGYVYQLHFTFLWEMQC